MASGPYFELLSLLAEGINIQKDFFLNYKLQELGLFIQCDYFLPSSCPYESLLNTLLRSDQNISQAV